VRPFDYPEIIGADGDFGSREELYEAMRRHSIDITCAFVPFSKSRHAVADAKFRDFRLCWKVTIHIMNKAILTADYVTDISHCRTYRRPVTSKVRGAIVLECEAGSDACPDPADALGSLLDDAGIVEGGFQVWAEEYGLDPDSRQAEAAYRECVDASLKLRHRLGDVAFAELQAAAGLV
jgi:hypothetical protein